MFEIVWLVICFCVLNLLYECKFWALAYGLFDLCSMDCNVNENIFDTDHQCHRILSQIGYPPAICRWWSPGWHRSSCSCWPTIRAMAETPPTPFRLRSGGRTRMYRERERERMHIWMICVTHNYLSFDFNTHTSLSVKWDLSFSCSGVKCSTVVDIALAWFFST